MTNQDKILLCAIRDFQISIDKANIYIATKNLLQAKLFLAVYFDFRLPLTFTQIPDKPPVSAELVPFLKKYNDTDLDTLAQFQFNRPYNKIIALINELSVQKNDYGYKTLTDTQWYELLAEYAMKNHQKTPLERLMNCFNNKPPENHQMLKEILDTVESKLHPTNLPKITEKVLFYDKYDIKPTIRKGLLLSTGEIIELSTYQYIPEGDYILTKKRKDD